MPGAFFGAATQTSRLADGGLAGWLFVPPLCACHLANPDLVGVVRTGPRVSWLAINGPAATTALLVRLLSSVRNAPVADASH